MARLFLATCLAGILAVVVVVSAEDKYPEGRFAHINLDELLSNQRILTSYIKCFLERGPCTGDARDMKKMLPEVIDSSCARCTDKQKHMMAKAVQHVKDHFPSEWKELVHKYDPDHNREKDLEDFLKENVGH